MERSKMTTILFPPDLHEHLARLAKERGVSLGQLVRRACERAYGFHAAADRMKAVEELARLELPVATPAEMKRQSGPTKHGRSG